ncbi:MAG: ABC transporter substrate-binding protein [Ramlibacter sp.]|nr:ABC transporter substrate-binding protein [Ramlibacter sp.]
MYTQSRRAVFAIALAASALAVGVPANAQGKPTPGGVLTASLFPEPPSLNPALQQVLGTQMVASKIYESLIVYSKKLEPTPGLARSWTVSPDRLTYTFNLQQGVKWHDGKPFTSADVLFTYKEILANSPRTRGLMENVAELRAPDTGTVVFRLKSPYSAFLYAFDIGGGAILPKHLFEGTELATNPRNNAPVGTGPFKFAKWERGSHVELVRNTEYWRPGLPYLDGITYRVIPDAASRRLALEQGTVMQVAPTEIEPFDIGRLAKNANLKSTQEGGEYWAPMIWIEMNNSLAPFNDRRFRQAMMYALDRKFMVEKIFFGQGLVSTGPIHHKTRFYSPDVQRYAPDLKKAVALLDEMGLKADAKGVRATVSYIPLPYGEVHRRMAEYLKLSLAKVGIVVNIESTDVGTWVKRVGAGDYQMAGNGVFQYGDPAIGVARTYLGTNIRKGLMFSNTAQYRNEDVDKLFQQAAQAPDAERSALYAAIQRKVVEDVPVLWIMDQLGSTFLHKRANDAITTGLGVAGSYSEAWLSK